MAGPISKEIQLCLKLFNQLVETAEQSDYIYRNAENVPSAVWTDELGRLRIWAANIAAHQTGQSSLDFRLRDASHISQQITRLLEDIANVLNEVSDLISEEGNQGEEVNESLDITPDEDPPTELQQLHEEVVTIIDCLYRMSMLIRKPANHDLLVGSHKSDKAEYEFWDAKHVREKHPDTDEKIAQRLGHAITRRRKYLDYRTRHHAKLKQGLEEIQGIERTTTESVLSGTKITDFMTQNIDYDENNSNSDASQTSYAPSLMNGGPITIPPPPKASASGKPFECPYCYFLISIKGMRSWTRHVFKDIRPYVCIVPECNTPDKLYDSRREWYAHHKTAHNPKDLTCPLRKGTCEEFLKTPKQFERHVARHLEELALFVLPTADVDDDDEGDDGVENLSALTKDNRATLDNSESKSSDDHLETSTGSPVLREDGEPTSEGENTTEEPEAPYIRQDKCRSSSAETLEVSFPDDAWEPFSPSKRQRPRQGRSETDIRLSPSLEYDVENSGKLKRLKELEKKEEEDAEILRRMKKLEELEKKEEEDAEISRRMKKLEELEKKEEEDAEISRRMKKLEELEKQEGQGMARDFREQSSPKGVQEAREEEEEEELKRMAIEEYDGKRLEEKVRGDEEKACEENEFTERAKNAFGQAGYDEASIERILAKAEKQTGNALEDEQLKNATDFSRPTYIKVHRRHLIPDTLDAYDLPWEWDNRDGNHIIIKRWIPEHEQEILFEHTRKFRTRKQKTDDAGKEHVPLLDFGRNFGIHNEDPNFADKADAAAQKTASSAASDKIQ